MDWTKDSELHRRYVDWEEDIKVLPAATILDCKSKLHNDLGRQTSTHTYLKVQSVHFPWHQKRYSNCTCYKILQMSLWDQSSSTRQLDCVTTADKDKTIAWHNCIRGQEYSSIPEMHSMRHKSNTPRLNKICQSEDSIRWQVESEARRRPASTVYKSTQDTTQCRPQENTTAEEHAKMHR